MTLVPKALVFSATLLVLAGCVGTETSDVEEENSPTTTPSVSESQVLEVPDGARAQGVVLAAFILTNGDIARAIEEGLVTPIEVELARTALRNGTLQQWVDAAG